MFQSPSAHVGSPTPWETSRCPPAHHYPQPSRHGSLPLLLLDAADVHARRQRPTIKRAAVAADVKLAGLALQIDLAVGSREANQAPRDEDHHVFGGHHRAPHRLPCFVTYGRTRSAP